MLRVANAPSYHLDILKKLQKPERRIVGPTLAASLETLAHHRNVANLSIFFMYNFGRC